MEQIHGARRPSANLLPPFPATDVEGALTFKGLYAPLDIISDRAIDVSSYRCNIWYFIAVHKCLGLYSENGQYCTNVDRLCTLYISLKKEYGWSSAVKRMPLDFLGGEKFQEAADNYVRPLLTKGVPSLFSDLSPLYEQPGKVYSSLLADFFVKNSNRAVFEIELKWYRIEAKQGKLNYKDSDELLEFFQKRHPPDGCYSKPFAKPVVKALPPEIVASCNGYHGKYLTLVTRHNKPVNVRLEKIGQSFYICKGWKKFVELTGLRVGQCIRFSVSSPSTLDLLVLDKHGVPKLPMPASSEEHLRFKAKRSIHQNSKVMVQSHRLLSITGSTNQRTPNPSLQMISKRRYWEPFNQHDPSQIDRPLLQPKKRMDKFRPQQWHKAPHSMHFPFLRLPIEEQPSISSEYAINVV
uniref:TF-B3 domain-containing protein n=1 Tax=Oryza barthii TaxID=65489 RepID=A0A0D3FU51_9ORYZ